MSRRSLLVVAGCLLQVVAPLAAQQAPLRLKPLVLRDPMVANVEAFRMLVPEGWRMEGSIVLRQELSTLAYLQMRVAEPSGVRALEAFPTLPYTWNERGYLGFPPGSLYLGMYVVQPMAPEDYVRRILLPEMRARVSPTIVRSEPLPDLVKQVAASVQEPGAVKQVAATRTRIEYQENGRAIEEDIYCILVYAQVPAVPGVTMWGPERLFGFRAEKGQLDRQAAAFTEYIRGVETYHDPFGGRDVQLPSGYDDVWVSRNGEYILTDDPNFNPNVSAAGAWQRVDPARH